MPDRPAQPRERLIVALDVEGQDAMLDLVRALRGRVGMYKVGKELFTRLGPAAVEHIRAEGGEVFLDLKYHDIPHTVAGAVRAAASLGARMLTVHALGGGRMVAAAVEAAGDGGPAVVAVTVLTSLDADDLRTIGLAGSPAGMAARLGHQAIEAGAAGVVCSAREASALRSALGREPVLVTPGVRPAGDAPDDQARVATPARAVADGADYLVVGRPITRADDPAAAADRIVDEIANA